MTQVTLEFNSPEEVEIFKSVIGSLTDEKAEVLFPLFKVRGLDSALALDVLAYNVWKQL